MRVPKISFQRFRGCDVLILDFRGSESLRKLLGGRRSVVLPLAEESLNFWVLMRMIFHFRFRRLDYYLEALSYSKARLLASWIDTNPWFYRIAAATPVPSIVFQNGVRNEFRPHRGLSMRQSLQSSRKSSRLSCTYYMTFGDQVPAMFGDLIQTKFTTIGSALNNSFTIENESLECTGLSMISSFPSVNQSSRTTDLEVQPFGGIDEQTVTFGEYFDAEKRLAQLLAGIADRHGLTFRILGKRPANFQAEKAFYDKHLRNLEYDFVPNEAPYSHTRFGSDVIVTIDSTFGYEMLSRGSKVVFVSNRLARVPGINRESLNFGYPVIRDAAGPFWTNSTNPDEISRLVSNVINMNADMWARCSKPIRLQLMPFDEGNSILNGTLKFLDDTHSETVPQ